MTGPLPDATFAHRRNKAMLGRSVNGIGTRIYGKRDFQTDGSFVTTKWVTFLWFPLFPLSSMRVRPSSNTPVPDHLPASILLAFTGLLAFKSSERYAIQSKRRPVLLQVVYVYGFVAALIFAWWNYAKNTDYPSMGILGAVLAAPLVLRAIGRARASEVSQESIQTDIHDL